MQVGCGADELIDLLMRCVLDPNDKIVDCPPTFTMYVFDAAVNGAQVVTVPRLDGFRIDVEGVCLLCGGGICLCAAMEPGVLEALQAQLLLQSQLAAAAPGAGLATTWLSSSHCILCS
jgi:hypothetical protein